MYPSSASTSYLFLHNLLLMLLPLQRMFELARQAIPIRGNGTSSLFDSSTVATATNDATVVIAILVITNEVSIVCNIGVDIIILLTPTISCCTMSISTWIDFIYCWKIFDIADINLRC